MEYQRGKCGLEETAQLLAKVRRETGCLELHAAPSASAEERALTARLAELVQLDGGPDRAS
jgi:hypothetical protein